MAVPALHQRMPINAGPRLIAWPLRSLASGSGSSVCVIRSLLAVEIRFPVAAAAVSRRVALPPFGLKLIDAQPSISVPSTEK